MPTYDYHCSKCDSTYELREGFDAPTTHKCQECGKGNAKRVLHAPKVVFKGSGWYVTDSRNKSTAVSDSPTESDSSDKKESKKSESTSTSSSDTALADAAS